MAAMGSPTLHHRPAHKDATCPFFFFFFLGFPTSLVGSIFITKMFSCHCNIPIFFIYFFFYYYLSHVASVLSH